LFGNWERDVNADVLDGDDVILAYKDEARPVLLAAGYKTQRVTESGVITINMYPVDIGAVFKAPGLSVHPKIGEAVELPADKDWRVEWAIGKIGLKRLIEAGNETSLPAGNRKFFVDGNEASAPLTGDLTTAKSTLTGSLSNYNNASHIGTTHGVNFYLEYVPFNLAATNWGDYDNISKFPLSSSPPVWIIRNGLNNEDQDNKTDFAKAGKPDIPGYKDFNGNGGILFEIKDPHESGYYVAAYGNDSNGGSFYAPFYTLEKALTSAAGTNKPVIVIGTLTQSNSGTRQNGDSTFIIVETVTVKGHPDPGNPPVLKGTTGKRVLATGLDPSHHVTLENITIMGGNGQTYGAGVYVNMGTLTLKDGAKVTRNGDGKTERGGGIFVNFGADLNMEGGEISENNTGKDSLWGGGGGLFVYGTANLKRGIITGNYSYNDGGGVLVGGPNAKVTGRYGLVHMYDGIEVSGNQANDDGGGIGVDYDGHFYMHGGVIHSNKSKHNGGGLRLEYGYVKVYPGALITGKDRSDGNAHTATSGYYGHAFAKYGVPTATYYDTTVSSGFEESRLR
jgi:hypothetical protein